jgi:hypothetical protein
MQAVAQHEPTTRLLASSARPNSLVDFLEHLFKPRHVFFGLGLMLRKAALAGAVPRAEKGKVASKRSRSAVPRRRYGVSGLNSNAPFAAEVQSNIEQSCCLDSLDAT